MFLRVLREKTDSIELANDARVEYLRRISLPVDCSIQFLCPGLGNMSTGTVRRVSRQDIQLIPERWILVVGIDDKSVLDHHKEFGHDPEELTCEVRSLIERCLQLDMNRKDVVETLLNHEKIDPGFTEHVWQKLEEENPEFFNAYYLRLMVKSQIIEFNQLLEQQARMMHQIHPCAVTALSSSNGSHVQPIHQSCYAPEHTGPALKQGDIDHPVGVIGNAYSNGTQPEHSTMHTAVDMSSHARNDAAPQSSNVGLFQGMNGGMIKVETGYSNSSPYMFGIEGNVLDARQSIGNASVASFASVDSNTPSFNESLLDPDPSSFGFISQMTRNFSLSDLTADFSQGSDILESYARCPFLPTEADNILDTCENGDRLDSKRLDNVSESLSYEDFRHH